MDMTMFMVLSSCHSHCESSLSSFDEWVRARLPSFGPMSYYYSVHVPVMGKSQSRFDLNRDLNTFGDLI